MHHLIGLQDDDGSHLEKEGLILDGVPKMQAEMMERQLESPLPVFGEPFPRDAWRQVAEDLKRQARKCQIPSLQPRIEGAWYAAKNAFAGQTPLELMDDMCETYLLTRGNPAMDDVAKRLLREACYRQIMKYAGRTVG